MPLLVAPNRCDWPDTSVLVFLAGSIEMGKAEGWQQILVDDILTLNNKIVVANPRRVSWDSSWEQSIDNPMFKDQVDWELDHIERANLVVFYFQPNTMSPITLLELGKHLGRVDSSSSTLVCCPDGFWRKGNVEIACQRAGLGRPLSNLDQLRVATCQWITSSTLPD